MSSSVQKSQFQVLMLQELDKVLNQADLSVTSERMIRAKLTAELGEEVQLEENLGLVKEVVKKFVETRKREADEELEPPPSTNPLIPKKRSRTGEGPSGSKSAATSGSGGGGGGVSRAGGGGGGGGGGGPTWIDLGGEKRASFTTFKGNSYIDLREYYSKGDEKLPGKKGIMLKPDEFKKVATAANEITIAARASNSAYALSLGNKRKVSISSFKGQTYVDVREFYDSNGEEKPGAKGLSMNPDQWQKLTEGLATLQALI